MGVSVGHIFVRVFARVFVVVLVWVGLNITWFNLGRLDQSTTCIHRHRVQDCMPSQTCVSKNESVVERLVGMTVCDEWMWCGVDVVYGVYEVCGECVVCV